MESSLNDTNPAPTELEEKFIEYSRLREKLVHLPYLDLSTVNQAELDYYLAHGKLCLEKQKIRQLKLLIEITGNQLFEKLFTPSQLDSNPDLGLWKSLLDHFKELSEDDFHKLMFGNDHRQLFNQLWLHALITELSIYCKLNFRYDPTQQKEKWCLICYKSFHSFDLCRNLSCQHLFHSKCFVTKGKCSLCPKVTKNLVSTNDIQLTVDQ